MQKRIVDGAEVRQIDSVIFAIGFEKDIRRFDIAVYNWGIVKMEFFENIDDLYGQRKDILNAESHAGFNGVGQGFAVNELLDEIGVRLVFIEVFDGFVKRRDARNVERLQGFGFDLSLVWFTVQTQENRSDYQRTKGKNTGNLPSMDLWLQEDCSRTWTYERPSSAGSRYNS